MEKKPRPINMLNWISELFYQSKKNQIHTLKTSLLDRADRQLSLGEIIPLENTYRIVPINPQKSWVRKNNFKEIYYKENIDLRSEKKARFYFNTLTSAVYTVDIFLFTERNGNYQFSLCFEQTRKTTTFSIKSNRETKDIERIFKKQLDQDCQLFIKEQTALKEKSSESDSVGISLSQLASQLAPQLPATEDYTYLPDADRPNPQYLEQNQGKHNHLTPNGA